MPIGVRVTDFIRSVKVFVGTFDVSGLHAKFHVKRTAKSSANTLDLSVFNPGPKTIDEWVQAKNPVVRLDVGYGDTLATIFSGAARFVSPKRTDSKTIEVEIQAGDAEDLLRAARIAKQVPAKVSPGALLRTVAESLGVKKGNLDAAISKLNAKGLGSMFSAGAALAGRSAPLMDRVCKSYGLEWSVQDGALQILERDVALEGRTVPKLTPQSGLIGSPQIDSKHVLSFECRLNTTLYPGAVVVIESQFVNGGFRLTDVEHEGDNYGGSWKTTAHGKKY
jgi:hypothetical protein